MKFGLFALFSFFMTFSVLHGQTFFANPGPLYEGEVGLNLANLCYIHFDNPSGDSLHLRWRKLEASMPSGWDVDICDYGTCYFNVPNTALMHWVYDTIQPYLKLIVQPGNTEGAAWFYFRVNEEGNTANFQDVYYSLHTSGVSSVQEANPSNWLVYPNPVHNGQVWIKNSSQEAGMAQLLDVSGRIWALQVFPASSAARLQADQLPAGIYFLKMLGKTEKIIVE
ncbi:MAG: T9SS type A sorting domain-containing protein [Bacteroidetes bacterium]|nr:T9SS type A sorting domain-containing protein [Bacteroidota bacterium]